MLESERIKLADAAAHGECLSIAINKDEGPVRGGFIPWEHTVSAFNMSTPEITISAADLQDSSIMEDLKMCDLIGLYIMTSLEDYRFISEFSGLRDIFIRHGSNIKDLTFLQNKPGLFMFYLEDADVPDLVPLIENCNQGEKLPGKCFGFYHCKVEDTSALENVHFIISELLVWPVDGEDRMHWKEHCPGNIGTFRFYKKHT